MKALIVCVSKYYGNTLKLANTMALVINAEVIGPLEAKGISLSEYDIVGFGSGIYFGKHDPDLLTFIDALPAVKKKAFIFSTRGRNSLFENAYHKPLREKLIEKSFYVVGEFSCRGFSDYHKIFRLFGGVNKGHPNNKDLDLAKAFAIEISGVSSKNL